VATTPAKRACSVCGTLLAEDSPYCPVCALRGAAETQSDSISDASSELHFEHYQVLRKQDGKPLELGHGAMGVTYKALDVNLRCPVALKVINARFMGDESASRRFVREARAAASIRHTNVASVLHLGRTGSGYFYAMEFVEGETLESMIRRSGRLEVKLALEVATQVAAGLAAVHKGKLVHRDIKPTNIMVSMEEGGCLTVKIIDLGLAKSLDEQGSQTSISMPGGFAGTPEFASPEQFAGVGVDIRSDLYSLGVVLWEMLTGRPPFRGTPAELIYLHQQGVLPFERLKGVPQRLTAILKTLLDKDPKRRFQTPAEFLTALSMVNQLEKPTDRKHEVQRPLAQKVSCRRRRSGWEKQEERSVAVLPFESLSASKNDTYFADGVQDEILSNLAKISQLKVISRSSVMTYRPGANRNLRAIANELGVARVIEGTVRRSGNRVRIATRLVDAQTGETLWADSYDRDLTDIFAIQSEIAQTVASKLRAQLSPEERKDIEEKPTNNLEAYDLYVQAKQLYNSVVFWGPEKETYLKAISLVEEATQKDPQFALAYCLLAQVQDDLYFGRIDYTPERRALGDAALNEAMRLRPDLPEVHLVLAYHLNYLRDFERARVQLAIAARSLPNNSDLLELTALIDQVQGRWEKSTAGLERAATLDPRNPHVLYDLANNYVCLRRYRDQRQILDRMTELELDQTLNPVYKAMSFFSEKADVKGIRAACEALPTSVKDDPHWINNRAFFAICARDFAAAEEIVSESPNEENYFFGFLVPRQINALWVEFLRGNHPTMEQFGAAREQLYRKVEADPTNPFLVSALSWADMALGAKEKSIKEGQRATEMRPISEDAFDGPTLALHLATLHGLADQPDAAFQQLNVLIKMPGWALNYGDLKTNPAWDPLRKDRRFEKLLAELAPRD
jgi:eukaryotic-like serine/threonine-protein kinase